MNQGFAHRQEAGRKLAAQLVAYLNHPQAIVLGLPRGGVPVAYEIATALHLPLDVCLVRKISLPHNPEVAIGAVAEDALVHNYSGNITILDKNVARIEQLNPEIIREISTRTKAELRWRDRCYRHFRPMLTIGDSLIILVDDGIATGLTMHAAIEVLQQQQPQPKNIIIATPVASLSAIKLLKTQVDDIYCLIAPQNFDAVSFWYENFNQITDQEVCELLSHQTHKNLATSY